MSRSQSCVVERRLAVADARVGYEALGGADIRGSDTASRMRSRRRNYLRLEYLLRASRNLVAAGGAGTFVVRISRLVIGCPYKSLSESPS